MATFNRNLPLLVGFVCIISRISSEGDGIQCYSGARPGSAPLAVISCDDSAHLKGDEGLEGNAIQGPVTACLVFTPYSDGVNTPTSEFQCDYKHVCNASGVFNKAAVTGGMPQSAGDVFCCEGALCNSEQAFTASTLSQPIACYQGQTKGNTSKGETVACDSGIQYCRLDVDAMSQSVRYRCDTPADTAAAVKCSPSLMQKSCVSKEPYTKDASCCCKASTCNKPLAALSFQPALPMTPLIHQEESRTTILVTYGTGAAVLLLSLILAGVVTIVGLRKCKQRQDEQYAYVYSQLTADFTDDDRDDDRLLVP